MSTHQQTTAPKGFYRMSHLRLLHHARNASTPPKMGQLESLKHVLSVKAYSQWVKQLYGESTYWRFPAPIKLTERITAWRIEDIEAWMASKGLEA